MAGSYDVIVIGAGLGGLTAAALLARAGRNTLVIERNRSVGGAASTYKVGDLVVEASLHETADPGDPIDPKHAILERIGVLDAVDWVPTGAIYEVRGGPVGQPFVLPHGFAAARAALADRYPSAKPAIAAVLGDMERISAALGTLSRGREAFRKPREGFAALAKLAPMVRDWRRSVTEVFDRAFGDERGGQMRAGRQPALLARRPRHAVVDPVRRGTRRLSGLAAAATFAAVRRASARPLPMQRGGPAARSCSAARSPTSALVPTGVRPGSCIAAATAANRQKSARRSSSPMRLLRCSRPCCRPRRASASGRPMPIIACRSRSFRRRSDCRCVQQRLASAAIRHSCCRRG